MRNYLLQGWSMTLKHKYVLIILFLYRLLWGFFLYRFIDSIVSPVLARYPNDLPNPESVRLFFIEAQFRLFKTDLSYGVLAMLAGMFLIRMIITPLINAGLFYSFCHSEESQGTKVLAGMRRSWRGVTLLYWIETLLTIVPLFWLVPKLYTSYLKATAAGEWLQELLPFALAWIVWSFAIHLLFQFMQFSSAADDSILNGLLRACRRPLPLLVVTLILVGLSLLSSIVLTSTTLLWTGFAAIVLHQAFQLVRSLLSLWTAASQYEVWRAEVSS